MPKHPSPDRYKISRPTLIIALFGAPLAWIVQMSGSYIISSYNCYPHQSPLNEPLWQNDRISITLLSIICLLAGLASSLIAYNSWRKTMHEANGDKKQTLDVGEGRARFLSMIGLLSSGLFIIAIIFTSCALILVSECR